MTRSEGLHGPHQGWEGAQGRGGWGRQREAGLRSARDPGLPPPRHRPHVSDASKRGIRLISYDRPGYGGSSPMPGRKVGDAAKDVASIADSMRLDRFAVWGISGGGPHALACAALLRDRVVAVASLASPAPYKSPGLDWLKGQGEDNVAETHARWPALTARPVPRAASGAADGGRCRGAREDIRDSTAASGQGRHVGSSRRVPGVCHEGGPLPGYEGWKEDDLELISGWGFKPSEASTPLLLWQGREDKMVPFAHGVWLSKHIPGVEARLSPEDGHLTLLERRVPETHAWLLKHF